MMHGTYNIKYLTLLLLIKGRGTQIVEKMDVPVLNQFFYSSYTYKLCFCVLSALTLTNSDWLLWQTLTLRKIRYMLLTSHCFSSFFMHPLKLLYLQFDNGDGWWPTSNIFVHECAWILCTHNIKYFNCFIVTEKWHYSSHLLMRLFLYSLKEISAMVASFHILPIHSLSLFL